MKTNQITKRNIFIPLLLMIVLILVGAYFLNKASADGYKNKISREEEWRKKLTPQQYYVLREGGTDIPFTSPEILNNKKKGTYITADCGEPVFRSDQKYDSGTGWPSFWAPIDSDAVVLKEDNTLGIKRVEVVSKKCGSHLGHVFDDGPKPTGKRYCINASALKFVPDEE